MLRRWAATLALLVGLLGAHAGAAQAGGGHLSPVHDRYEPGQAATLVGYTSGPSVADPLYAYLRPSGEGAGARLLRSDVYVGELTVEETAHTGYLGLRVSLTFAIPGYLAPGIYDLVYCDDPCTGARLGDLVASPFSVGVDPARRVVREWALDDPEIANLAPDALLVGPDYQLRAADLREPPAPTPGTTPVPSPVATEAATVAAPAPPAPDDMAWPLPSALVVGAAIGTGLVLTRRPPRPGWVATGRRTPGAAPAGRG